MSDFNNQFLLALGSELIISKLSEIIKMAIADINKETDSQLVELTATIVLLRNELHARDVTIASLKDDCDKLKGENNSIKQHAIDSEIMYK